MSLLSATLAAGAVITLLAAGYLLGARRGVQARALLRRELDGKSQDVAVLRGQLSGAQQHETNELRAALGAMIEPLRAQEQKNEEAVRAVLKLVQPVMDKDRLSLDLKQLTAASDSRSGLCDLLDRLRERGAFVAVVLSDEAGLPMACNRGCAAPETLAGISSLLLILADRVPRHGAARPQSFVLHDEAGQVTLHRIFEVGRKRYLLSIVASSAPSLVQPELFDTPIARLRSLLSE